jgi:hypothetical protein
MTKKIYSKPILTKKQKLSAVTSVPVDSKKG